MRSDPLAVLPQEFLDSSDICQHVEDLPVERFVSRHSIEDFSRAVPPRASRVDKGYLGAHPTELVMNRKETQHFPSLF